MGKGIFFTLLFGALFLLLFSLMMYYSGNLGERKSISSGNQGLEKYNFISDDISTDLLSFLEIRRLQIARDSTRAWIFINETLPSPYSSPSGELAEYESFIEGRYARLNNLNNKINLDLSSVAAAPLIYFSGANLNYSYASVSKNSAFFKGSPSVEKYSIALEAAAPDQLRECGWETFAGGAMGIELQLPNSNCPPQFVSVDPLQESRFWVNTSAGNYVNLTFGQAGGNPHSYGIRVDGTRIMHALNVTFASAQAISAWLPAKVQFVNGYELSTLRLRSG